MPTFSRERTSRCHVDARSVTFCDVIVWKNAVKVEFSSACAVKAAEAFWPTSSSNCGMEENEVVAFTRRSKTRGAVMPRVTSAWYEGVPSDSIGRYACASQNSVDVVVNEPEIRPLPARGTENVPLRNPVARLSTRTADTDALLAWTVADPITLTYTNPMSPSWNVPWLVLKPGKPASDPLRT